MVTLPRSRIGPLPVHNSQIQILPANPALPTCQAENALMYGGPGYKEQALLGRSAKQRAERTLRSENALLKTPWDQRPLEGCISLTLCGQPGR